MCTMYIFANLNMNAIQGKVPKNCVDLMIFSSKNQDYSNGKLNPSLNLFQYHGQILLGEDPWQ